MPHVPAGSAEAAALRPLSGPLTALFAAAAGLAVANIYYAQPLIDLIAPELQLQPGLAGLIVALTQLGYGAGLLLLVPLADVVENRRLSVRLLGGVVLGLLGIGVAHSAVVFLLASFVVGVCAVATQILVPMASQLAPEASRGRVVGNVMGGLLAGIMLARPFSSFVAATLGWRAVFFISAAMMLVLMALLQWRLPRRDPGSRVRYGRTLASLPRLFATTPLLRRRAFYQGMMFAAFNVFWTGVPLLLAHAFGFDQRHIALFALAGAAGALAAPLAGRLADRGWTRPATGIALATALLAFVLAGWSGTHHALWWLVLATLALDAAVQVCQVLSLRSIYMLAPELRGRLNGLFMTSVFLCGAAGSALAAAVYFHAGWLALSALGGLCAVAALALYATEFRPAPQAGEVGS